jgi:hypothetical protein
VALAAELATVTLTAELVEAEPAELELALAAMAELAALVATHQPTAVQAAHRLLLTPVVTLALAELVELEVAMATYSPVAELEAAMATALLMAVVLAALGPAEAALVDQEAQEAMVATEVQALRQSMAIVLTIQQVYSLVPLHVTLR